MTATVATFYGFCCPVCGALRDVSPRALRLIAAGVRTGECKTGEGCRVALDGRERNRRWWLLMAGVDEMLIRRAGGAVAYVDAFGLPSELAEMARSLAGVAIYEPLLDMAAA
jgi:hypothetical protein